MHGWESQSWQMVKEVSVESDECAANKAIARHVFVQLCVLVSHCIGTSRARCSWSSYFSGGYDSSCGRCRDASQGGRTNLGIIKMGAICGSHRDWRNSGRSRPNFKGDYGNNQREFRRKRQSMVIVKKGTWPTTSFTKLHHLKYGLYKVRKKFTDNTHNIELPSALSKRGVMIWMQWWAGT